MHQLFKRPKGQIKVVISTATPPLATHSTIIQLVNAGAGVSNFHSDHAILVPALRVEHAVLLIRVACRQYRQRRPLVKRQSNISQTSVKSPVPIGY